MQCNYSIDSSEYLQNIIPRRSSKKQIRRGTKRWLGRVRPIARQRRRPGIHLPEPNAHAADCSCIRARSRTPARSDEKWPAGLAPLQSGLLVAFRETHGEHVIGCSREERDLRARAHTLEDSRTVSSLERIASMRHCIEKRKRECICVCKVRKGKLRRDTL